ncbi:MAG: FHA domain-containing protein [Planctomycetales bacterium]|nr:FHA domain-containing protein [Planctomycetales bacterium]
MASVFVIKGQDQGRRFDLRTDVTTLGRDVSNVIRLRDTEVSRKHAEIRLNSLGEGYVLHDLGSSNGTFVNSEPATEHALQSGDRIQLGCTLLVFTGDEDSHLDDVAQDVDIVSPLAEHQDESRIISSLGNQEGSQLFAPFAPEESPWLARARSNLQVMYRTALAVSHTLDIDQLLARIMDLIFEWVEADRGCIMLSDPNTEELIPKARRNRPGVKTGDRLVISQTILDYVLENREGVLTSDAQVDQRWDSGGSIVKLGVREAIAVPMQGRYGIVGLIYIDTFIAPGRALQRGQINKFTDEHLKLMVAIAHQAALAVEDTSYYSAMVQAERLAAIGQTIAGLSHHIKNILQGIRGGSYLIKEGLNTNESEVVRKGWSIVEKNQEKISRLVLDMLTFSKEREPDLVPSDLNQVTEDVIELMHARFADAKVDVEFVPDVSMPNSQFDPEGMHHAILNVVTNAVDACEERESDRKIWIRSEYDLEHQLIRVLVKDNGGGIPASELKKIFALFESKKGHRGTGLGLSVSQKILEEHGGEIRVTSELNRGTEFTLELPVVFDEADNPLTQG